MSAGADNSWIDELPLRKRDRRIAELERLVGDLKAALRVNMLRRAQPGEDIDAEIDRVFAELERK